MRERMGAPLPYHFFLFRSLALPHLFWFAPCKSIGIGSAMAHRWAKCSHTYFFTTAPLTILSLIRASELLMTKNHFDSAVVSLSTVMWPELLVHLIPAFPSDSFLSFKSFISFRTMSDQIRLCKLHIYQA